MICLVGTIDNPLGQTSALFVKVFPLAGMNRDVWVADARCLIALFDADNCGFNQNATYSNGVEAA